MPVECRPSPIPYTVTQFEDGILIEWEWQGDTFQRRYQFYGADDHERALVRDGVRSRAHDFANRLKEAHLVDSGPAVFKLTPDDRAERDAEIERKRKLMAAYVQKLVDGSDGAKALAEELRLPLDHVREDDKIVKRFLRCREQYDKLADAQRELAEFQSQYTGDRRLDMLEVPSIRAHHGRLKIAMDNCRLSRRGMADCQSQRPALFVNDPAAAGGIRLACE